MVSCTSWVAKNWPGFMDEAGRPDTSGEGTEEASDFLGSPSLLVDECAEGMRAMPMSDGYCSSFTET